MLETLAPGALGVLVGVRHALEPDHVTAVSTLAVEQPGARRGAILGALWGVGHSVALVAVTGILSVIRTEMPERLSVAFELAVAVMLLVLGARGLARARREAREGPSKPHVHGSLLHIHPAQATHIHVGPTGFGLRSLVIGLVHGLAGSGAVTALAMAKLPTAGERLLYIGLFGAGSVIGMAVLSGLAGWPLAQVARHRRAHTTMQIAVAILSVGLGLVWGAPLVRQLMA